MSDLGVVSHLTSGVFFLALSLLLLTSWKGRLEGGLLAAATGFTAIWSLVLAWYSAEQAFHFVYIFVLETLRAAVWLTFMLRLMRRSGQNPPRLAGILVHGLWMGMLGYALLLNLVGLLGLPVWSSGKELIVGSLLLSVVGMALVEQLYRNTAPERRWGMKYLYFALGFMFVYDLFLYSQTLLFREIDIGLWSARGAVYVLSVPLIGIAAARNPNWSVDVFVSRRFMFHTATVLAAALYLLVMAAAGYYLRAYGGNWGLFLQVVFFSGAVLLLVVVLSSGRIRARIRVFISKNFYSYKYDYRDEWLRLTQALTRHDLNPYTRGIVALAQPVESAGGLLWTADAEGVFHHRESWNLAQRDFPAAPGDLPLLRFLADKPWVVNLRDERPPIFEGERVPMPQWLTGIGAAWLLVPLYLEQRLMGMVVLLEPRSPQSLTWEDFDLLKIAGHQVASFLAQYEISEALIEARQFEAFSRLSTFIMHDLKNVTGQLSLISLNAAKHKTNPAFIDDAFSTVDNAVARMKRLLAQLRHGRQLLVTSRVTLGPLLDKVIRTMARPRPVPRVALASEPLDVEANHDKLAAVLGNLIINAQEAAGEGGSVGVELARDGERAVIEITDDGPGMDESFIRERLFKPFETTKGEAGMGIGAFEAREYVGQLGGELRVSSTPGQGSCFRIILGLARSTGLQRAIQD